MATYALALEASTGLSVVDGRLVFCATGEPIERRIEGLGRAIAEVQSVLRCGSVVVTS